MSETEPTHLRYLECGLVPYQTRATFCAIVALQNACVTNQPKKTKGAPQKENRKTVFCPTAAHIREKKREKYHLLSHFGDAQTNTIDMRDTIPLGEWKKRNKPKSKKFVSMKKSHVQASATISLGDFMS